MPTLPFRPPFVTSTTRESSSLRSFRGSLSNPPSLKGSFRSLTSLPSFRLSRVSPTASSAVPPAKDRNPKTKARPGWTGIASSRPEFASGLKIVDFLESEEENEEKLSTVGSSEKPGAQVTMPIIPHKLNPSRRNTESDAPHQRQQQQGGAKSKNIFRRITTLGRSTTRKQSVRSPVSAPLSDAAKLQREAALRERGLLPPLRDNRNLSEQEAEQDKRLTVVSPSPANDRNGKESGGMSAADRIKQEWEAKNRSVEERQRERMMNFKFGRSASSLLSDDESGTLEATQESLSVEDSQMRKSRPPSLKLGSERLSPAAVVPPSPLSPRSHPYLVPLPPSPSPSPKWNGSEPSASAGSVGFGSASSTTTDTPRANTPRPAPTATELPEPLVGISQSSPDALRHQPAHAAPPSSVPTSTSSPSQALSSPVPESTILSSASCESPDELLASPPSAATPSLSAPSSAPNASSVAHSLDSALPTTGKNADGEDITSAARDQSDLQEFRLRMGTDYELGHGGLTWSFSPQSNIPVIVESDEAEEGITPRIVDMDVETETRNSEQQKILNGQQPLTSDATTDGQPGSRKEDQKGSESMPTPTLTPTSPSFPSSADGPSLASPTSATAPSLTTKPRKSLSLFKKDNRPTRALTLDTGVSASQNRRLSSSFATIRRSVVGSLSRSPHSPTSGYGGGRGFNASHLPPSPTLPDAFRQQQQGVSDNLRVRQPLSPTIHSRGSILIEAAGIEDDETRRVTELAFLG